MCAILLVGILVLTFQTIQCNLSFARYNIDNDVRKAMYEEAETWMKAVGRRKFMGGSAPNLADLVKY